MTAKPRRWKSSDYIVAFLASRGVAHVYELCGGMLAHLLDSFSRQRRVSLVSMHHEQAAGFAAEGDARVSGIPGVAMATSGPGACNLLTAVGSCFFDGTPAVFITGQVNRKELKGRRPVRQLGFQETDIVTMARPIAKAALRVMSPQRLPGALDEAFRLSASGRPGPVLLDIPMDVQRMPLIAATPSAEGERRRARYRPDPRLDAMFRALGRARRPLILAGGGIRSGLAVDDFRKAVGVLGVPVVHSLMGLDVLGHEHPLRVGMIGSYGNRWANKALGECDFLLVVGSRLDIRQTGADTRSFSRRTIFHVDVDRGEINNRVKGAVPVVMEVREFAERVSRWKAVAKAPPDWIQRLQKMRRESPDDGELRDFPGVNPNKFMKILGLASRRAKAFVVDVGQHQMWAAQSLPFHSGQRFITSGGMGAMGFALPASVGVSLACGRAPVVVVAGDGGFQLNIQELQTVVRNRLPLKIVVLNNKAHGMVRQFQGSYFGGRFQSTVTGYSVPEFVDVARAYGLSARRVGLESPADEPAARERVLKAVEWLWADPRRPAFLEVGVPTMTDVLPKLAFGRPISQMEPDFRPLAIEGT